MVDGVNDVVVAGGEEKVAVFSGIEILVGNDIGLRG